MGITVPSGRVVVVGPAVKLTTCWPKPVATASTSRTVIRTAAFSVAFDLESLIRIMVLASRSGSIMDIEFLCAVRWPAAQRTALHCGLPTRFTAIHQLEIRVDR